MTAFSDAFRAEVLRMARKEIKGELGNLRKTVTTQRSEIAALKRDVKALVTQMKALHKAAARKAEAAEMQAQQDPEVPARRKRQFQFKAEALAARREELGISQQAMAALLEASALSISRWESGKVMPRAAQLERIQQVLKMSKREALAKLQI
ncbi:helix-turn-helix domain-containing protein [Alicycliphilus sp. T452]